MEQALSECAGWSGVYLLAFASGDHQQELLLPAYSLVQIASLSQGLIKRVFQVSVFCATATVILDAPRVAGTTGSGDFRGEMQF